MPTTRIDCPLEMLAKAGPILLSPYSCDTVILRSDFAYLILERIDRPYYDDKDCS